MQGQKLHCKLNFIIHLLQLATSREFCVIKIDKLKQLYMLQSCSCIEQSLAS